ncbi:MAG: type II toxin-antitoxin system Phd/YefM family antitoxin [Gammaproteobacteria bacterium]|nr:type II toxin-antitoxin system Phd/YefM family antitoxin [Gammaproteobacteria bacterium]
MHATQKSHWLLSEAKNRFSEVARSTFSEGPQTILRREGNVVLISEETYQKLIGKEVDFKTFLLSHTPDLTDLDLSRDKSPMRDTSL